MDNNWRKLEYPR